MSGDDDKMVVEEDQVLETTGESVNPGEVQEELVNEHRQNELPQSPPQEHDAPNTDFSSSVTADEDEEEAKRCRLDRGLFALLYHELVASRLNGTAKKLLREAGVDSVEFSGGVPPRLRDLVDVWNERQTQPLLPTSRPLKKAASPVASPTNAPKESSTSGTSTVSTPATKKIEPPTVAASSTNASLTVSTTDNDEKKTQTATVTKSNKPYVYVKPFPGNKPTSVRERERMQTGKGTRGPWLQEEEQKLKDAVELYGDSNLEVIEKFVKTRSLKGIAKHLMRTKKGWGLEHNKLMFEALLSTNPSPSMDRFLKIKPEDRAEKDIVTWLEWFIIHNNIDHPLEHIALGTGGKAVETKVEADISKKPKPPTQPVKVEESTENIKDEAPSNDDAAVIALDTDDNAAQTTAPAEAQPIPIEVDLVDDYDSNSAPVTSPAVLSSPPPDPGTTPVAIDPVSTASNAADTSLSESTTAVLVPTASDKKTSTSAEKKGSPVSSEGGNRKKAAAAEKKAAVAEKKAQAAEKRAAKSSIPDRKSTPPSKAIPPKRQRLVSVAWTQMEEELLKMYFNQFKGDLRRITKRLPNKTQADVEEHIQEMQANGVLPLNPRESPPVHMQVLPTAVMPQVVVVPLPMVHKQEADAEPAAADASI